MNVACQLRIQLSSTMVNFLYVQNHLVSHTTPVHCLNMGWCDFCPRKTIPDCHWHNLSTTTGHCGQTDGVTVVHVYNTIFSTIDHDNCLGFPHLPFQCDDYQVVGDPVRDQRKVCVCREMRREECSRGHETQLTCTATNNTHLIISIA